MSNYLHINVPVFAAYLDTAFTKNELPNVDNERILVEVFAFTSIPRRCAMFSVMTEYGAQFARVPLHYLRSQESGGTDYPLDWLQLWDTYSYYSSISIIEYTKNSKAHILLKDKTIEPAKYLFTIDSCLGPQFQYGYSEMAGGHKNGHVFEGDNGQYYIQPNNRVIWKDGGAFINKKLPNDLNWKVFTREFTCERSGSRWTSEQEEDVYFYGFKPDEDGK